MRIAFAILCLTAIGLTVVVCRHAEVSTQQEIHRLQAQLMAQRRQLWDLDVWMGQLTSMQALEIRAEDMQTHLLQPHQRMQGAWDQTFAVGSPPDQTGWSPMAARRGYGGAQ